MKIAVFEPFTRTAGITTWAFNAAAGFRDVGHECDVVSFTKSGRPTATRGTKSEVRPGWRWWRDEPDVVASFANSVDVLNDYDLVVLNEPKNGPCDGLAKKAHELPTYVTQLRQTKTPWITTLHDRLAYTKGAAPYLAECVDSPSFTGIVVEARPGSYDVAAWALAGRVGRLVSWPWLPYVPVGRAPDVKRTRAIGLGGRITSTKGFLSLASVADRLPPRYEVHLLGAEAGGMGAAVSFTYYEALAGNHGWTGVRGDPTYISPNRSEWSLQIGNYGAANTAHEWWLQKDGHTMRYVGPYLDGVEASTRYAICAQLTTERLATTIEYTTIEAMDAGCVMVMPRYYTRDMRGAQYDAVWLERYGEPAKMSKKHISWADASAADELVHAIEQAVERVESGAHDPSINQAALAQYHAPRHLANKIIETVGR